MYQGVLGAFTFTVFIYTRYKTIAPIHVFSREEHVLYLIQWICGALHRVWGRRTMPPSPVLPFISCEALVKLISSSRKRQTASGGAESFQPVS